MHFFGHKWSRPHARSREWPQLNKTYGSADVVVRYGFTEKYSPLSNLRTALRFWFKNLKFSTENEWVYHHIGLGVQKYSAQMSHNINLQLFNLQYFYKSAGRELRKVFSICSGPISFSFLLISRYPRAFLGAYIKNLHEWVFTLKD